MKCKLLKKLRKEARLNNPYRLMEIGKGIYRIERYQDVSLESYMGNTSCPVFQWLPILIIPTIETKDYYIKVYYNMLEDFTKEYVTKKCKELRSKKPKPPIFPRRIL